MPKLLVVHPEAKAESQASYDWYYERNPSAAERFVQELDHAYREIAEHPERYPEYPFGPGRFRLFRSFPYFVIYFEHADHIGVYAVAHGSREPGYSKRRATDVGQSDHPSA